MDPSRLILNYVNSVYNKDPKRPALDRDLQKGANRILALLQLFDDHEVNFEEAEFLEADVDMDLDPNYDPSDDVEDFQVPSHAEANAIKFSDGFASRDQVLEAIRYYGSGKSYRNQGKKRPSLTTMRARFPFIKSERDLRKLFEIEKDGDKLQADKKNNLAFISKELKKRVDEAIENGHRLQEHGLRYMIKDIIHTHKLDIKFKQSHSWINKWKRANCISSRRITCFVAKKRLRSRDDLLKAAAEFRFDANSKMSNYQLHQVFNADQSGFQLEMHGARTLAHTGSKKVICSVQSATAITHSYTILPLLCADGTLAEKLFIVMAESGGTFPAKGHIQPSNLVIKAGKSHIMTKEHMKQFFEECVFHSSMPDKVLLMVDSWTSWKDSSTITSITPATKSVETLIIPAGCTGMVQPCDVGFFGGFKHVVKHITMYGERECPTFVFHHRDSVFKLMSAIYRQLRSPTLKNWILYAFYASGYNFPHPPPFITPFEMMFPRNLNPYCGEIGCRNNTFIHCDFCNDAFCFKHFFEDLHDC